MMILYHILRVLELFTSSVTLPMIADRFLCVSCLSLVCVHLRLVLFFGIARESHDDFVSYPEGPRTLYKFGDAIHDR
jgi:hypothetical protein